MSTSGINWGATKVGVTKHLPMDDMQIVIQALEAWEGGALMDRLRARELAHKTRTENGLAV